jgi:hypothetical protein
MDGKKVLPMIDVLQVTGVTVAMLAIHWYMRNRCFIGRLGSLADDDDFTGKLIVGVAPGLFFSGYEYRHQKVAGKGR